VTVDIEVVFFGGCSTFVGPWHWYRWCWAVIITFAYQGLVYFMGLGEGEGGWGFILV